MTVRAPSKTVELLEMMLFVTCAKVWKQQQPDASFRWLAIGTVHPFLQTEPQSAASPGFALMAAYESWKQQNP